MAHDSQQQYEATGGEGVPNGSKPFASLLYTLPGGGWSAAAQVSHPVFGQQNFFPGGFQPHPWGSTGGSGQQAVGYGGSNFTVHAGGVELNHNHNQQQHTNNDLADRGRSQAADAAKGTNTANPPSKRAKSSKGTKRRKKKSAGEGGGGEGGPPAATNNPSNSSEKQQQKASSKPVKVVSASPAARGAFADQDAISPPCTASGGIPDPTPAYLLRASFLARTLPKARAMLVVIDLNGTLLFRPSRNHPTKFVERPHARRFLEYCIATFYVVIWSSARPQNVNNMCRQLLSPDQQQRVVDVWARDRFGLTAADYSTRTQCYKRLTKLWADPVVAASHPDAGAGSGAWNQGNTVLIDDSIEKARSEPFNAITIPEFNGDINEQPTVLPLVHDYLNTLAHQADISTYIRSHPFAVDEEASVLLQHSDSNDELGNAAQNN